jgi:hypothetical protein
MLERIRSILRHQAENGIGHQPLELLKQKLTPLLLSTEHYIVAASVKILPSPIKDSRPMTFAGVSVYALATQ